MEQKTIPSLYDVVTKIEAKQPRELNQEELSKAMIELREYVANARDIVPRASGIYSGYNESHLRGQVAGRLSGVLEACDFLSNTFKTNVLRK